MLCAVALAAFLVSACDDNCLSVCLKYPGCDGTCKTLYGINYTDPDHACARCEPKCLSACNIKGAGTCDRTCYAGYCLNLTTYQCSITVLHCTNCSNTNGSIPCTKCDTVYALASNGQCMACDPNCAVTCNVSDTCPYGSCKPKFVSAAVPNASPIVYTCAACDVNCNGNCSSPGTCDGPCLSGYVLSNVTKTCIACSRNCTGGCDISGAGFCDCPCAAGFTCSPAIGEPTKNACYPLV
jgi:hypothetical protein